MHKLYTYFILIFTLLCGFTYGQSGIVHLQNGELKSKAGDFTGAIVEFNKAIKADPKLGNAYFLRGMAKVQLDKHAEAIADFTTAISLNKNNHETYFNRALSKMSLSDFSGAVEDFTVVLNQNPLDTNAYQERAFCKRTLANYAGAREDYTKIIGLNPKQFDAYINRALVNEKLKDYSALVTDYSKLIELNPADTETYCKRGKAKYGLSDFNGAIVDYSKAIEIDSTCSEAFLLRGKAKFAQADYTATLKDWDKASSLGLPDAKKILDRYKEIVELSKKQELEKERQAQIASSVNQDSIYKLVGVMPEFPGGEDALMVYVNRSISYPAAALSAGIEGKVFASFVVNKNGKISDVKIIRGLQRDCDKEVIRIIKLMPNWIPGELKGIPVNVRVSIPIVFRLN